MILYHLQERAGLAQVKDPETFRLDDAVRNNAGSKGDTIFNLFQYGRSSKTAWKKDVARLTVYRLIDKANVHSRSHALTVISEPFSLLLVVILHILLLSNGRVFFGPRFRWGKLNNGIYYK